MEKTQPKRKLGDVFLLIVADLGAEFTPAFRKQFNQEIMPRLKCAVAWEEELTEEEYEEELAQLRRELPGVIRRLQKLDFPLAVGFWRVDRN